MVNPTENTAKKFLVVVGPWGKLEVFTPHSEEAEQQYDPYDQSVFTAKTHTENPPEHRFQVYMICGDSESVQYICGSESLLVAMKASVGLYLQIRAIACSNVASESIQIDITMNGESYHMKLEEDGDPETKLPDIIGNPDTHVSGYEARPIDADQDLQWIVVYDTLENKVHHIQDTGTYEHDYPSNV